MRFKSENRIILILLCTERSEAMYVLGVDGRVNKDLFPNEISSLLFGGLSELFLMVSWSFIKLHCSYYYREG